MAVRTNCSANRAAGFTLIEILAVLAILGLLMSMAIYFFGSQKEQGYKARTVAIMEELKIAITRYQTKNGSPPFDSLAKLKIRADNDGNEGAEALYAALHNKNFPEGASLLEEVLGNSDNDSTATSYHRNDVTFLLEAKDGWDNPIAYITAPSYGKQFRYVMSQLPDDSQDADQVVSSRKSTVTGVWANPDSYQLISAGTDRRFGTDDDVTNFQ